MFSEFRFVHTVALRCRAALQRNAADVNAPLATRMTLLKEFKHVRFTLFYCNVQIYCDRRSIFSKRQRITLRLLYAIGRPSVVCLSVVCDVGAPYSGG